MARDVKINIDLDSKKATKNMDNMSKSVGQTEKNTENLRKRLGELRREMQGLEIGSQKFNELAAEAGALDDQLGKINASIKVFASDTMVLDTTIGVVQGMGGAYQAVSGAIALAGVENEKLIAVLTRLQAIQAVLNGVNQFANMINRQGTVIAGLRASASRIQLALTRQDTAATAAQTAATGAQTVATTGATVATRALAVAMNALPFVAILTGIGLIVSALIDWGDAADDVGDGMDDLNDKQLTLKRVSDDIAKSLDTNAKLAVQDLLDQIQAKEHEIKVIEKKGKKTEEDFKREKKLKEEIIDLNGKILETQKAYAKADLTDAINWQREYQRELNLTSMLISNIDERDPRLTEDVLIEKDFFERRENAVSKSIKKEEELRDKIREIKLSDFNTEAQFMNELAGLQRTLAFQVMKTESEIVKFKDWANKSILKDLDVNLLEMADNYTNYIEGNKRLDEEEHKVRLINQQSQTKQKELANQKELLDLEEKARKAEEKAKQEEEARKLQLAKFLDEKAKTDAAELQLEQFKINELTGLDRKLAQERFDTRQEIARIEDAAVKDSLKSNEAAYLQGKINWEKFLEERQNILDNKHEKLLDSEEELVDKINEISNERLHSIEKQGRLEVLASTKRLEVLEAQRERLELKADENREVELLKQKALNGELVDEDRKFWQSKRSQADIFRDKEAGLRNDFAQEQIELIKAQTQAELDEVNIRYAQQREEHADNKEKLLELEQEYLIKRQEIIAKSDAEIREFNEELTDDLEDDWMKLWFAIELAAQETMKAVNAYMNLMAVNTTNSINRIKDVYDADQQALNDKLQNNLISQEEHDNQLAAMEQTRDAEIEDLQRKQFNREKALKLANVGIDAASASVRVWANPGFPAAIPLQAIIAVQSALSAAAISRERFRAAQGGVVPGAPSDTDSVDAFLAPGEAVINSKSSQAFLPLLSAINQAGGGVPLVSEAAAPTIPSVSGKSSFQDAKQPVFKTYVTAYDINRSQKERESRRNRTKIG